MHTDTKPSSNPLRIGVDIGGTFTDFVVYQPESGMLKSFKLLSTPHDPAQAVLQGLELISRQHEPGGARQVIHGSTVATNALLERKGACTALVTTRGFRDILQIGRQNRPELYDFFADPPAPLVPQELRFEVNERVDKNGKVLQALDSQQIEALEKEINQTQVESIAVCLLFSFTHPEHEQKIADKLRAAGYFVSLSSEILPEYREFERASTTTVNAYVTPVLDGYLAHLKKDLGDECSLCVMQSNGGVIRLEQARREGVRCILSGPAGGVIGAGTVGAVALSTQNSANPETILRLITFDMGGTSTDVALINGSPQVTSEAEVGGCPIRVPILDIHTIGAGGGSIAYLDPGGALRVGPQSAGADPGPACYGKGQLPTVTDANLVLGRLSPEHFMGGEMQLDSGRAWHVLQKLGEQMGLEPEVVALGVVEVANAHMERALRVISVERGHDPRRFTLLSFGGAGGLHAADLARRLGIPRLLIPPLASTLSAFGMLAADVVKDYSLTVMLPGDTPLEEISARLEPLSERGKREVREEGVQTDDIIIEGSLDMRYRGQSYEMSVPFSVNVMADFHTQHHAIYGYNRPEAPVEIVNLRLKATGGVPSPLLEPEADTGSDPSGALENIHRTIFIDGGLPLPRYRGERLRAGNMIKGPALVVRADTTVLIPPGDQARVDPFGNLAINIQNTINSK